MPEPMPLLFTLLCVKVGTRLKSSSQWTRRSGRILPLERVSLNAGGAKKLKELHPATGTQICISISAHEFMAVELL